MFAHKTQSAERSVTRAHVVVVFGAAQTVFHKSMGAKTSHKSGEASLPLAAPCEADADQRGSIWIGIGDGDEDTFAWGNFVN
jgi:hypothetical protein